MARQRAKSMEDISRQQDRVLAELIRRNNDTGTPFGGRYERVTEIAERYKDNILKSKQGKIDYKKVVDAVRRNGSAPREAQVLDNRQHPRRVYMGLSNG